MILAFLATFALSTQATPWVDLPPILTETVPGSMPYVIGIAVPIEPALFPPASVTVELDLAGTVITYDLENLGAPADGTTAGYGGLIAIHARNGDCLDRLFVEQDWVQDYGGALRGFDGALDWRGSSSRHGLTSIGTTGSFDDGFLDCGPSMYTRPGLEVFLSGDSFGGGWSWPGASAMRFRMAAQARVRLIYR